MAIMIGLSSRKSITLVFRFLTVAFLAFFSFTYWSGVPITHEDIRISEKDTSLIDRKAWRVQWNAWSDIISETGQDEDENTALQNIHLCPDTAEELKLDGVVKINKTRPTWHDLELLHHDVDIGGHYEPKDCIPRHNVAIIVPYRDREKQLLHFLRNIHAFLKRQKISYTIYVAEQISGKIFNRGLDRNIGFIESLKLNPEHECAVFHDVDLQPIDERNLYTCPDQPRQLCLALNYIQRYKPLRDNSVFGGVVSFRNEHFEEINGYSNIYLGWGAEDDDAFYRVQAKGLNVLRYPPAVGRYYGIPHKHEKYMSRPESAAKDVSKYKLLALGVGRMMNDGISTANYTVLNITKEKLFTRILFDVEQKQYEIEAVAEGESYDHLYGNLTTAWHRFGFVPKPYWWKDNEMAERIRNTRAQKEYETKRKWEDSFKDLGIFNKKWRSSDEFLKRIYNCIGDGTQRNRTKKCFLKLRTDLETVSY